MTVRVFYNLHTTFNVFSCFPTKHLTFASFVKSKNLLKTMEKYYLVDVALRNVLLGHKTVDYGHVLENVIYLELLRRYPDVYIGKVDDMEIDFVAVNMQEKHYYQIR